MRDHELQQWLQLTLSWQINASRLKSLFDRAGSVSALKELAPELSTSADLPVHAQQQFVAWQRGALHSATARIVDAALEWASRPGNHIVGYGTPDYPSLLATCSDPPPQLFVKGDPAVLHLPQLAMVGSRKPTADGRRLARRFARELIEAGYQVTSGLALGIDAESHEGALEQQGITIAVLGSGLNRIHPISNAALAERIAERGAVVSEFPPDTSANSWHFPERNRIISGLSHGVLVVEAAERSGSLITARLAAEQGREVFAIPGSINNPLARGCHSLIRQGARLAQSVEDILSELPTIVAWERKRLQPEPCSEQGRSDKGCDDECSNEAWPPVPESELPEHGRRVLDHVAYDPVSVDSLAVQTALPVSELLGCLLQLELLGLIATREGAYVLSR